MNLSDNKTNNYSIILDDLDYSEINYLGEIKFVPLAEIIWKVALFVSIILTAVAGNILIIVVVAWNKRLRTTTNYYIVNLAVSDLFVTIWCSWVYLVSNLTEGYVLGAFFCKFNTFAQGKYTCRKSYKINDDLENFTSKYIMCMKNMKK